MKMTTVKLVNMDPNVTVSSVLTDSDLKLDIIDKKAPKICPNPGLIKKNMTALDMVKKQFYNPATQDLITCLVKSAVNSSTLKGKNPAEHPEELIKQLRHFFGDNNKSLKDISIRGPYNQSSDINQRDMLINEGYVGTVYLNDLRKYTSSFKYIYSVVACDKMCTTSNLNVYLIEEAVYDTITIESLIESLPPNEESAMVIHSILIQLITVLEYASNIGVSNFPFNFSVRKVDKNTTVPLYVKEDGKTKVVYIKTLGYIPMFYRYHTASSMLGGNQSGTPKSLMQEQDELTNYIESKVAILNPKLATKLGEPYSPEVYEGLLSLDPNNSLACSEVGAKQCQTFPSLIKYFQVPFERIVTYAQVLNNASEELVDSFYLTDKTVAYESVMEANGYILLLKDLTSNLNNNEKVTIFGDNDLYVYNFNDLTEFNNELHTEYLTYSYDTAKDLREQQKDLTINVNTLNVLFNTLINLSVIVGNITFFNVFKHIVNETRVNVGSYNSGVDDFLIDAVQEAKHIKEKIEMALYDADVNFLITSIDDSSMIIARLYEIFIGRLPDNIKRSMNSYITNNFSDLEMEIIEKKVIQLYKNNMAGLKQYTPVADNGNTYNTNMVNLSDYITNTTYVVY